MVDGERNAKRRRRGGHRRRERACTGKVGWRAQADSRRGEQGGRGNYHWGVKYHIILKRPNSSVPVASFGVLGPHHPIIEHDVGTRILDQKNKEKKITFCWKALDHSLNNFEELTQWAFFPLGLHLPTQLQTWMTLVNALKSIIVFIETDEITKTSTLTTTFHKPAGGANIYVRFGYSPLKHCSHTRGKVSGSMNSYPIDMMHTIQQSTKEGLKEELEGDFRLNKSINWIEQVWTPNRKTIHDLPQSCGGGKSICLVWIRPTDDFQSRPGKQFRINECWYGQCKQTGLQSMTQI